MEKRNPADIEADEYFDLQISRSKADRVANFVLLAVVSVFILACAAYVWLAPQKDFSENENRYLQTLNGIDFLADLESGRLTGAIADMYSDQFPLRKALVETKATLELTMLKHENNGVIVGHGGALIAKLEYTVEQEQTVRENLDAIARFLDVFSKKGSSVSFAIAPRSIDVLEKYLPPIYSSDRANSVKNILNEYEIDRIMLESAIKAHADEYVWFLTDHHWTMLGAYYAYVELASTLGYQPLPLESFTVEEVTSEFYGTTYSKAGIYSVSPDSIKVYRFEGDEGYTVRDAETKKVYVKGFYDSIKLGLKDKYSYFLGGDYGHITVSNVQIKPRLLVVKDSYFDALAPFLAIHFDLDVIDLRYYSGSVAEYAEQNGIENVLILCGEDSLATSSVFTMLEYKLKY